MGPTRSVAPGRRQTGCIDCINPNVYVMGLGENSTGVAKTAHSPAAAKFCHQEACVSGRAISVFRPTLPTRPAPPRDRHRADFDRLESLVGWAKARSSRRAHRGAALVGTLRFAHPTTTLPYDRNPL